MVLDLMSEWTYRLHHSQQVHELGLHVRKDIPTTCSVPDTAAGAQKKIFAWTGWTARHEREGVSGGKTISPRSWDLNIYHTRRERGREKERERETDRETSFADESVRPAVGVRAMAMKGDGPRRGSRHAGHLAVVARDKHLFRSIAVVMAVGVEPKGNHPNRHHREIVCVCVVRGGGGGR